MQAARAQEEVTQKEKEKEKEEAEKRQQEQQQREQAQRAEQERTTQEKQRQEQLDAEAEKARAQRQAEEETQQAKTAKLKELPDIHYRGQPGEMRPIEKSIIAILDKIKQDKNESYDVKDQNTKDFIKLVTEYQRSSFGNSTEAFLNDPVMKLYFSELHAERTQSIPHFPLWMLIEHYTLETSEENKADYLKRIETQLQKINKVNKSYRSMSEDMRFRLRIQPPTQLDDNFIKNVYLTNDPALTHLFMENPLTSLPLPQIKLFESGPIPAAIQKRHEEIEKRRAEEKRLRKEQKEKLAAEKAAAEKAAAEAEKAKLDELAKIHYVGKPGEMRPIEQNIIAALQKIEQDKGQSFDVRDKNKEHFQALVAEYQKHPFGNSSEAFLNHSVMKPYFNELHKHTKSAYNRNCHLETTDEIKNFRLWMLVEHYNLEKSSVKKANYLKRIKIHLQEIRKEIYKPSGQGLFTQVNQALIKNIYLSGDPNLIKLFMNNPTTKLPIPGIELFEGGPIPAVIQKRHDEAQSATAAFKKRLPYGEAWAIHLQREARGRQRQRKEKSRLAKLPLYRQIEEGETSRRRTETEIQEEVHKALVDSNTPYIPKRCSREFAKTLVEAANKVQLFDTIRHETSESYLNLILDEGLKGKKTLLEHGRPFKKGALKPSDLEAGGDANVICFGVQEIVPEATYGGIQITLDVNKIKPNPCMFYKQRDFGYPTKTTYESSLAGAAYFTHGDSLRNSSGAGFTNLQIKNSSGGMEAYSELPAHFFMAYDVSKMHQILTLNFFRFIDTLCTSDGYPDESRITDIYASLEKIFKEGGESALIKELEHIGKGMTRTAEVDFYSTYLIDLSAVQSIKSRTFTLELPSFISELQKGNMAQLMAAQKTEDPKGIPNLFKSYRFLDYLLSKPYPENILAELNRLKALCPKPAYLGAQYNTQSATGKTEGGASTPGGAETPDPRSPTPTSPKK